MAPQPSQPRPSETTFAEARLEQARSRYEAFTAGPMERMGREMAQRAELQSLSRAGALDATRSEPGIHVPSFLSPISEMMKRTRQTAVSSLSVYCKSDELFHNAGDRRL